MKTYYKIVENDNGQLKTVHYCINRSRNLERGKWISSAYKMVADRGKGKRYRSGIHILWSRQEAEDYLRKFKKNKENKIIVECQARHVRLKNHKTNVLLAGQIKII